jgi:hypothetical protein
MTKVFWFNRRLGYSSTSMSFFIFSCKYFSLYSNRESFSRAVETGPVIFEVSTRKRSGNVQSENEHSDGDDLMEEDEQKLVLFKVNTLLLARLSRTR